MLKHVGRVCYFSIIPFHNTCIYFIYVKLFKGSGPKELLFIYLFTVNHEINAAFCSHITEKIYLKRHYQKPTKIFFMY